MSRQISSQVLVIPSSDCEKNTLKAWISEDLLLHLGHKKAPPTVFLNLGIGQSWVGSCQTEEELRNIMSGGDHLSDFCLHQREDHSQNTSHVEKRTGVTSHLFFRLRLFTLSFSLSIGHDFQVNCGKLWGFPGSSNKSILPLLLAVFS